jgi:hypothetical protein
VTMHTARDMTGRGRGAFLAGRNRGENMAKVRLGVPRSCAGRAGRKNRAADGFRHTLSESCNARCSKFRRIVA